MQIANKKPYIIIGSALVLVVFFLFYWFQVRPESIRKECYKWTTKDPNLFDRQYRMCLLRNGLER